MKRVILFVVLTATFLLASGLYAAGSNSIAIALKGSGEVTLTRGANSGPLKFGTPLNSDDVIKTGADGAVTIMFTDDKSLIKLKANTSVTIAGKRDQTGNISKRVGVEIGELFAKVEKQKGVLEIATPTSVASVKGTEFWVVYDSQGNTYVTTLEGLVALRNNATGESVDVKVAQRCELKPDGTITFVTVKPQDLPQDPDPLPESTPLKTLDIEIQDSTGAKKSIQIHVQDSLKAD